MSAFDDVIANGLESIASVTGDPITYHRGNDWYETVGVKGSTSFDIDSGTGVITEWVSADWIIPACDFLFSDDPEPRRKDIIKYTKGNKVYIYDVVPPTNSDQVFRFSDRGNSRMRVHTQLAKVIDK